MAGMLIVGGGECCSRAARRRNYDGPVTAPSRNRLTSARRSLRPLADPAQRLKRLL